MTPPARIPLTARQRTGAFFGICLLLFVGAWYWVRVVHVPAHTARAVGVERPIGNVSDLYPHWLATRELLVQHRNPYSAAVTRDIQIGFYGRPLDPSRPFDPKDRQGFVYPLYVVFLLAPTVHLSFAEVQTAFRILFWIATVMSVPLWLYALGVSNRRMMWLIGVILLMLSNYAFVQAIYFQQFTLLVSCLLAAAFALIVSGRYVPAGVLLALATIKPQLVALPIAWILLWAISDWHRRKRLLASFVVSMILLFGGSEILLPGWIGYFLFSIRAYSHYAFTPTILEAVFGSVAGRIAGAVGVGCYAALMWHWRKLPANSTAFALQAAVSLTVTILILPNQAPYNYVLFFPSVVMLARSKDTLWNMGLLVRALYRAGFACLAWYWLAALASSVVSLVSLQTARRFPDLPFYTFYAFFLLCTAVLCLLVVKTWKSGEDIPALAQTARGG